MLGPTLRRLIHQRLISVKTIEEATGRGESTVYRWLSGRTRPDVEDVHAMLLRLDGRRVRQEVLSALTHDLPVTTIWHDPPLEDRPNLTPEEALKQALDRSVEALRVMSELLADEREMASRGSVDQAQCQELAGKIDDIIHHLSESRLALCVQSPRRRRAT